MSLQYVIMQIMKYVQFLLEKNKIIHWDIEDPISKLINANENEKDVIILNTFEIINEKIKHWIINEK
jgi:hypothetical protein